VRYYLGSAHYRSTIDYHEGSLVEAEAAFSRIEGFLDRVARAVEATPEVEQTGVLPVPDTFAAAMDDDLGVPQALGVLHEAVRQGNAALDAKDVALAARLRAEVVAMLGVLGLDPAAPEWADTAGGRDATLASLVEHLIGQREAARASKDFAAADTVRDTLAASGITLEDGPDGTRWTL
jgi:cysteinyl-tRNA synthetase